MDTRNAQIEAQKEVIKTLRGNIIEHKNIIEYYKSRVKELEFLLTDRLVTSNILIEDIQGHFDGETREKIEKIFEDNREAIKKGYKYLSEDI